MTGKTYQEIATIIEGFGLPYAYYQFPDGTEQEPPFICFFYEYEDVYADDSNYVGRVILHIELYTDNKDIATETTIENALAECVFSYGKQATYITSERMWQTAYTMEVLING